MPRYVPNTYNNRRILRVILWVFVTIALSAVILFFVLFFIFQAYFIDGRLDIPWLNDSPPITTSTPDTD